MGSWVPATLASLCGEKGGGQILLPDDSGVWGGSRLGTYAFFAQFIILTKF